MHDTTLSDYILPKTKWSATTIFAMVDWDAHGRAFKRLTQYQKITIAKLIHDLADKNCQNHLYYGKDNRCPGCQSDEETLEHILKCSYPDTESFRTEQLQEMQTTLQWLNTQGFWDWLSPPTLHSQAPTYGSLLPQDILLTSAYYKQFHQIGWYHCCLGRISRK
jgi:hypothetical protein